MSRAQPPLETRALNLRQAAPADAKDLLALSQEDTLRTWLPSQVYRDEAHAHAVLEFLTGQYSSPGDPRRGAYVLLVEHKSDRRVIGHVGFSPFRGGVEIGFAIAQDYQRRGLAAEAIVAACAWAFEAFGLDKILGVTSAGNIASKRTLIRAGFAPAGEATLEFQSREQAVSFYVLSPATLQRRQGVQLGAFSISLAVKDIEASRAFYEKLGFKPFAGNAAQRWLILKNGEHVIGLFQGMFEKNILTFNPGWDQAAQPLASFTDIRDLQRQLKAQGIHPQPEADEKTTGPASFVVVDPDGNPILVDQHL